MKKNKFLLKKLALPLIRKAAKESPLIKHYIEELKLQEDGKLDEDMINLLSVISLQDYPGTSILPFLTTFNRAARMKVLSPLTFKAEEWSTEATEYNAYQNKRLSSVFSYFTENTEEEDLIVDIDSLTWINSEESYNITTKTKEPSTSPNKLINGVCLVYDKETDKFAPVWSGNIVHNTKKFMGENQCKCECLEIKEGDNIFCRVTLKSKIPKDFYKDYILTDVRKLKPEENNTYEKEIKWCMSNRDKLIEMLL